jgi:tyrosinase
MPANGFGAASFSRIDYGGDKDVFELTVTVGGILRFFTLGQTDTFGELHSDNGFLLSDDDSGSGNNFDLRRPVAPGRYFIVVRHYDASKSGDYQLYLDFDAGDDVGNACQSATHIALSGRTYGAIGHAGDEDYFRIQASGAGSVRIRTQGPTDTYGSLLNSACQVVASDDDSGPEANFEIFKNLPAGSYYIAVRHYRSTAMGNYTLYLNPID